MKKTLLIVLGVLCGIYVLALVAVYSFQKRIIFLPSRCTDPPPGDLNIREVYFPTGDGQVLHGWWMPADSGARTLLFFHGNAGCVPRGEERARFFSELGFNTLMIDYRGYGKSTGEIENEEDIYTDGQSAVQFLADSFGIRADRIILYGWSLGGAVAVETARRVRPSALVLEGTFNSMDEIAARSYPLFPTRWLLRYHFRSGDKIGELACPVMFIHSRDDLTIPYEQGVLLSKAVKGRMEFLDITGSHNHGYYENKDKVIYAMKRFLLEKNGVPGD